MTVCMISMSSPLHSSLQSQHSRELTHTHTSAVIQLCTRELILVLLFLWPTCESFLRLLPLRGQPPAVTYSSSHWALSLPADWPLQQGLCERRLKNKRAPCVLWNQLSKCTRVKRCKGTFVSPAQSTYLWLSAVLSSSASCRPQSTKSKDWDFKIREMLTSCCVLKHCSSAFLTALFHHIISYIIVIII